MRTQKKYQKKKIKKKIKNTNSAKAGPKGYMIILKIIRGYEQSGYEHSVR